MRQLSLFSQTKTLARSGPEGVVYVKGADLYYGDTSGNEVQLTAAGQPVNGGTVTINIGGGTITSDPVTIDTSLPSADVSNRGDLYLISQTSEPDKVYICLRLSGGTYDWFEITRAI